MDDGFHAAKASADRAIQKAERALNTVMEVQRDLDSLRGCITNEGRKTRWMVGALLVISFATFVAILNWTP